MCTIDGDAPRKYFSIFKQLLVKHKQYSIYKLFFKVTKSNVKAEGQTATLQSQMKSSKRLDLIGRSLGVNTLLDIPGLGPTRPTTGQPGQFICKKMLYLLLRNCKA